MKEEERQELYADARVFALAAPVILPLLEKRKREAFGRLMQAHKAGQTDTATIVAELSAFTDIEQEIKQKESIYRQLEEEYGSRNNRK